MITAHYAILTSLVCNHFVASIIVATREKRFQACRFTKASIRIAASRLNPGNRLCGRFLEKQIREYWIPLHRIDKPLEVAEVQRPVFSMLRWWRQTKRELTHDTARGFEPIVTLLRSSQELSHEAKRRPSVIIRRNLNAHARVGKLSRVPCELFERKPRAPRIHGFRRESV